MATVCNDRIKNYDERRKVEQIGRLAMTRQEAKTRETTRQERNLRLIIGRRDNKWKT